MNSVPLIIHTDWSRSWGGQEIRTLTELREMKKLGFRVAMIVRDDSELARRGQQEGIPVHFVDFSSKFNLTAWRDLYILIRRLKPAVVNTHSSEDSWMAGCVAKVCRVSLIIKTRHVLASISSSFSYNVFFDVIFSCSESIGKQLVEQGVASAKIIVQSTGIDEERFQYSESDRQKIRKRYNISEQDILVGNIAFLRTYKGHDFIVRTAATMPDNYKFMIVGGGYGLSLLQEEIARVGVEDRFILTGHREDPEHYFSAMDIIFFSSYETEGISQSFIQGLLYGIPLLTCRPPSIMETLGSVHTYRDIDHGDVDAAHQGLLDLSRNLQRNEAVVTSQRQAVAEKYGLKKMVENIARVYREHGVSIPHLPIPE
ncbi:MAG: glycosyltransferase [Desulfocapsa sp.]|uniref:Glycosyltransferase n=1 Tax=Desulfotalea psychrophila TaxID=84980 RepID=A0ABS3AZT4_9BACT|nr:glycosyltransferase [Desulfocapsa sp.]MBN4068830.1 glycosyltransferase [Desulfotalea psychrophila]